MSSALQHIGNYRLLKHLGSGGQASVYLGEHLFLKRRAAIKILHTSLDEQNSALFLREAQILASLDHPHIIRLHDFTIEQGEPLLAMDYAPGGTLRSCYPTGQPLPLEILLTYLTQIASALQYAHDRGIIHRDIKPENLLLDEQQQVKLSDFGLALLAPSPEQLKTQELIGTVFYMAPEQLRGKPGFASDQYALGILLYEWLCGERPFQGTSIEVIGQHLTAEMPPLRLKRPDLPQQVDAVVRRALAKDPRQRFNSVLEFAQAFEHACHADLPVSPGLPPRLIAPAAPTLYATVAVSEHTVRAGQRQQQQQIHELPHPAPVLAASRQQEREYTNRQRMLAKVRSFWIDGVLEQSLRDSAYLVLGLHEAPGAVAHPWELVLQQTNAPRHPLPSGISIIEIYDRVGGELLILGNPGSGKTTLLLELARDLLKRAEDGELALLPVVFNLSSWAEKRWPLNDWLVEELHRKYQVPRKLARAWVEQDLILPLLDGLDEMAPGAQSACVEALNIYRREHGLLPMVICCRTGDYFAQQWRVQLDSSVEIQPLTSGQIEDYLAAFGQQFEPVRVALQSDSELRELVSTPLMLNILVLAYRDQPLAELLNAETLDLRQRRLFETYVQRMLERRGGRAPSTPEQTTRWLSWLAKSMRQHDQTVFYLDRLQPSALSTPRQHNVYHALAVRLPGMLMGGLIGIWVSSLFTMTFYTIDSAMTSYPFAAFGCLFGLFLGFLLTGRQKTPRRRAVRFSKSVAHVRAWMHTALMYLTHTDKRAIPQQKTPRHSPVAWTEQVRNGLILGICAWLVQEFLTVLVGLSAGMGLTPQMLFTIGLADLWLTGLPYALIGFLASLLIKRTRSGNEGVREEGGLLSYLWRSLTASSSVRHALIGSLLGLIVDIGTLVFVILSGHTSSQEFSFIFTDMLNVSASFGIISLLASLFIQRAGTLEIEPTEKITWSWESLLGSFLKLKHLGYALLIGLCYATLYGMLSLVLGVQSIGFWFASVFSVFGIVALVGWLLITLFGGWSGEMLEEHKLTTPNQGMRRSAFSALLFGLLSWLVYGGITWLAGSLAGLTPFVQLIAQDWLRNWFFYGLPCALTIGLLIGGWACLKHAVLRWQLRKSDAMPRHYRRFLDYAAERILLRKVGGGYLFIHRLLLDYFASLENDAPKD